MTSLLPPLLRTSSARADADPETPRPVALIAAGAGAAAAAGPLVVCLGLGVVGWFLTDSGAHGAPRDGLRAGALAWLMAHGSGLHVEGIAITAMPLGLTLVCAWVCWRLGHRLGVAVSGHGPDAHELADGQRDWTVPMAAALFAAGYAVVAVLTCTMTATPATAPNPTGVVLWTVLLTLLAALPGIAVGSGRASVVAARLPVTVLAAATLCRRIVVIWCLLGLLAFAVALALDLSTAANVLTQIDADGGAVTLIVLVSVLLVPNAAVFSGSYLLGPGFVVGTGTLVSPGAVVLGPLPAFPMLAALPDDGAPPGWTSWYVVVPYLVAFIAALWTLRARPIARYEEGAIRGGVGGVAAGLVFGVLASLAGGAVGPGRMADVGPPVLEVTLHAVAGFGVGGLLGGLAVTWWQRRVLRMAD